MAIPATKLFGARTSVRSTVSARFGTGNGGSFDLHCRPPRLQRRSYHGRCHVLVLPRRQRRQGRHDDEPVVRASCRNLLPASYGTQPIPTLLGADGGANGNYENDHPIGPKANVAGSSDREVPRNHRNERNCCMATPPDSKYNDFIAQNYGAPIRECSHRSRFCS